MSHLPDYRSWDQDDLSCEAVRLANLARHVAAELHARTCPTAPPLTGERPYRLFDFGELRHEKRRIALRLEALEAAR